jgi:hypothetical protein
MSVCASVGLGYIYTLLNKYSLLELINQIAFCNISVVRSGGWSL